ncbi:hypothetical protein ILUMI_21321 [Ignelater luminosus]|uniref:Uncharacterized protein n=1 Tax=Ignelater luminosus TaxID=2038154 RepID=A0A8K0CCM9_IGNLU|nr:hypothetical protein ILUMI_21321 [Ignelater luminosus]
MAMNLGKVKDNEDDEESLKNAVTGVTGVTQPLNSLLLEDEFENNIEADDEPHNILLSPTNPFTLYAASLRRYVNCMSDQIRDMHKNLEPDLDDSIVIPKMPEIIKHTNENVFNPASGTDFSSPIDIPDNGEAAKKIYLDCISKMLAELGYETSFPSILDMIVNISVDFLKMIIHVFNTVQDEKENVNGLTNFCKKVSCALELDKALGLTDSQIKMIEYVGNLQSRSKELKENHEMLLKKRNGRLGTDESVMQTEESGEAATSLAFRALQPDAQRVFDFDTHSPSSSLSGILSPPPDEASSSLTHKLKVSSSPLYEAFSPYSIGTSSPPHEARSPPSGTISFPPLIDILYSSSHETSSPSVVEILSSSHATSSTFLINNLSSHSHEALSQLSDTALSPPLAESSSSRSDLSSSMSSSSFPSTPSTASPTFSPVTSPTRSPSTSSSSPSMSPVKKKKRLAFDRNE